MTGALGRHGSGASARGRRTVGALLAASALLLAATSAEARVTRFVVDTVVAPTFEGASFAAVGPYEKIRGRLFGEVDPNQADNRLIQDIDLAPRNAHGRVEYVADVLILKPVDLARSNGILHLALPNRGRTLGLTYNVDNPPSGPTASIDPTSRADAGDGFLMRRGYMIAFVGWQGDIAAGENRLRLQVPVATHNGAPITGAVRQTYTVNAPTPSITLAGNGEPQVAYPAADLADPSAVLRRRARSTAPWETVPRAQWTFADCTARSFPGQPDPTRLCPKGGLDPNQSYELTYTARDPKVTGLGLAAIRDASAFFRHDDADDGGAPNPLAGHVRYVVATGLSQAGNFMRTLVRLGFTRDEAGRPVFDGMMAHLSGKRTPVNLRFAAPGTLSTMFDGPLLPGHEAPLTWSSETDPGSGKTVGLLDRCTATGTCPKIFNSFTSTEYRQYAIAYTALDWTGSRDLTVPSNVRLYFLTGSQHGTVDSRAAPNPTGPCQLAKNNGPNKETQRALLVAMDDWITAGREPPPNRIATLAAGELVAPDQATIGWPAIPGVAYTAEIRVPEPIDFGPEYRSIDQSGILALPPRPIPTSAYRPLVPRVDPDGNERAGIRPTALQAPVGTYMGWNIRRTGYGGGELCSLSGAFVPFATTKAERLRTGDPRLSIEERYGTHDGYVAAVRAAADDLMRNRFLLREDADRLVDEAEHGTVLR